MDGRWMGDGWEVHGRWTGGGREVDGRWTGDGWDVDGRWMRHPRATVADADADDNNNNDDDDDTPSESLAPLIEEWSDECGECVWGVHHKQTVR